MFDVNAPLRRLSVAVLLLFGLLLLNANYLQVVRADDLHTDANNSRLIAEEYSRERGPVLVGPDPVARSVETDDQLKYLREYTDGELYAPATGFYSLLYGASGVERERNSVLAGTDGSLFVRRIIDLLTGTQPKGGSVRLTLQAKAQRAAYRGLQRTGGRGPWSPSTRPPVRSSRSPAARRTTRTCWPHTPRQRCGATTSGSAAPAPGRC